MVLQHSSSRLTSRGLTQIDGGVHAVVSTRLAGSHALEV